MSRAQRRYIFLDNGLGAALINFFINAGIAWAMFHGERMIPLWGPRGIAADTIATSLVLPFMTCLIVTRLTDWHVRAGRLESIESIEIRKRARSVLARLPERTLSRAGVIALASSVVIVPITLGALVWLGVERLELWPFLLFKASFAVVDGALVTPLIAFLSLTRSAERVVVVK